MILNVKDINIGSKLLFNGNEIKIDRYDLSAILYNDDEVDHYSPIELTDKDVKQYGHLNLIKVNDDYFVCFGNYKTQIKFYHELQNYYYLVNHEEL